ncbi:hypothetical protein MGYG_09209 [Nannizzia gypsea CBS 118893]|uniref:Uncharacterized protein n=1 Tax=Arthroderma gypseum (strain ATCC MYA-4604 / CBS 118893) TaxID=535722 RepID=E4V6Y8_ARTGP|nr:hypothetical protein MGYG_09209 [Nannizzia gypsea CBS 118893]EFQ96854.1 hypothetical protein MGYG_09209 [Nannizzia gypsea CBS 118893]
MSYTLAVVLTVSSSIPSLFTVTLTVSTTDNNSQQTTHRRRDEEAEEDEDTSHADGSLGASPSLTATINETPIDDEEIGLTPPAATAQAMARQGRRQQR